MPRQILHAIGILAFSVCATKSAVAALAANVSISMKQPGFHGRVDVGQPIPQIGWVHPQPVIVTQPPRAWQRQPIYLYVPPAHSSNWARCCGRYNACAQPVVFVQDHRVRARYAQARYEHDHGRPYVQGRPGRDSDRDGIRNARDKDLYGDGDDVRNKHDRAPDNPYRR